MDDIPHGYEGDGKAVEDEALAQKALREMGVHDPECDMDEDCTCACGDESCAGCDWS